MRSPSSVRYKRNARPSDSWGWRTTRPSASSEQRFVCYNEQQGDADALQAYLEQLKDRLFSELYVEGAVEMG